jgi:UDP-N-acetylmuramoyl-tripeptide--D-alanyl-D-alanine ligase
MKTLFRFIITKILALKAKHFLKKNKIQVIAVTGSIAKTTTKEAIFHLLKKKFKISKRPQGFNTELGISLAILQEGKSGFSSIKMWFRILKRALFGEKEIFQKIILEMGADKPGDIKKLTRIARPKIGVITNVNPVHLEKGQFSDLEDIRREKNSLVKNMAKDGIAVLNFDDPLVKTMETGAHKVSYGLGADSEVMGSDVEATNKSLKFKVSYKDSSHAIEVPVLGAFQVYAFLAAITVALKLGISLKDCAEALKDFQMPPGRMNPLPGHNNTYIIDSSYNASPVSNEKALELLSELRAERKIAALGTMNELGDMTKESHLNLGAQSAKAANLLFAVGPEAVTIKQGALDAGMKEENIYTFLDSEEAGHALKQILQPKDLVLVKGSQNKVRMEKLVKVIMEHPEQAKELLCRQDEAWENI